MKSKLIVLSFFFLSTFLAAQRDVLPNNYSAEELAMIQWQQFVSPVQDRGIPEPPPHPVRHMAEWEELQALAITWRSYPAILREIVRYAKQEVPVIIVVRPNDLNSAKNELLNNNISLDNVQFLVSTNNSVWIRDYGPNCVYANDVEELYFIDWIYNRISRPLDDVIPDSIGKYMNIPVYCTTTKPDDFVATGGNFMSDGLGTAFSSKLILEENAAGNIFNAGPHTEAEIDAILQAYMGIDRYIKMETLPFDLIHHIDMHMRLLDEETLLVGQYPEGVSDGPQIEANTQYVLNNFNSAFDTPYKTVRVVQPPDFGNIFPSNNGDYRTYTNAVFVNKTILVPTYEQKFDTTALRIYRQYYPGYKVVGINCNQMIGASGALHCITKEIGVADPLWIVHKRLEDIDDNELQSDYQVDATIKHKSGIAAGQIYYTIDTLASYQPLPMTLTNAANNTWTAYIPHQPNGTEIFYYIGAEANSGKTQVRPLPAPASFYNFKVDGQSTSTTDLFQTSLEAIYPNPASAVTVIPVKTSGTVEAVIEVADVLGRVVEVVFDGQLPAGKSSHFINAARYLPGTYFVTLKSGQNIQTQKLIVK